MKFKELTLLNLLAVQSLFNFGVHSFPYQARSDDLSILSIPNTELQPLVSIRSTVLSNQIPPRPLLAQTSECPKLAAARSRARAPIFVPGTLYSHTIRAQPKHHQSEWQVYEPRTTEGPYSIGLNRSIAAPPSSTTGGKIYSSATLWKTRTPMFGNSTSPSGKSSMPNLQLTTPQFSTINPTLASISTSSASTFPSRTVLKTIITLAEVQTVFQIATVPGTTGTVNSILSVDGCQTLQPFNTTVIPSPTAAATPLTTGPNAITTTMASSPASKNSTTDIFQPIALVGPPPQISHRSDHPVPRTGIVPGGPLQTNKFYANFFLGDRTAGAWTHPYSVAWVKGAGSTQSWGLSISHVDRSQQVLGPVNAVTGANSYFINPIGIQSIIISAAELSNSTTLALNNLKGFSVNVTLAPDINAAPSITFPLVQGMSFVTGIFNQSTPLIQSSVFFNNLTYNGAAAQGTTVRYTANLNDGTTWLIYLTSTKSQSCPVLTLLSNSKIQAAGPFTGTIQVAKNNAGSTGLAIYDSSAGVYPIQGYVTGLAGGSTGSYGFSWQKGGNTTRTLLMFALPHHLQTFDLGQMQGTIKSSIALDTTTKGVATAIFSDLWTMTHTDLPWDMGFAPWSPKYRSRATLPSAAVSRINSVAASELNENYQSQTDLNSMYFSGKALAKLASIVYATAVLANNTGLGSTGLLNLKTQFSRFVNNTQIFPLVYDSSWGGAVSSASYNGGDPNADFGNSYYNDHHFHYGYFVYTAAVIGYLDPSWIKQGTNKAWVNMLVRDYANPSVSDGYYPFSRMFDWYHGHSWAHGLYETFDGKDEESSSEDVFATYALKMWGRVTGDASMEARGNMMLAIQAASLNNYFLYQSNNTIEPSKFIGNKVSGILFENKIDHTTYFGTNPEYIQGIHMIPLSPASTLIRRSAFVQQEWNTYFSNGRADQVSGGWRGILYANLATIDPKTAWNFFAQDNFDNSWLDGGASRTWYMALCVGWGAFT